MQQIQSARLAVDALQNLLIPLNGELTVPPAYTNIASATAFQINGATKGIALGFVPKVDMTLDSASIYKAAVGAGGNLPLALYADGLAYEPNGVYNGGPALALTMTANNLPAPYVAALKTNAGANAEAGAGFEAFKAFDGSVAADNGTRSNAAPTAPAPIILTLDTGTGISLNKIAIYSYNNADANVRAYPKAFTLWGSNLASPAAQTDADWTQLTGFTATAETDPGPGGFREYSVANATSYRHVRLKMTDRNGANAYVAIGSVYLFAATQRSAPGTLLQSFGNWATGAGAAAWGRATWTAYQLQRGVKYWLTVMGNAGVDVSPCYNRVTGTNGTEFPDFCETLTTGDTGTTWTQAAISGAKAMLCAVLNSTTNHVPKLYYGRKRGMYDALPDVGLRAIPAAGASLACDDTGANLTAGTFYYIYEYDNAGTLAIEASATAPVTNQGIEVKAGATSRRLLGAISPIARVGVNVGPIYVPDYIGVTWRGAKHFIRKTCPYVTNQPQSPPMGGFAQLGITAGDYTIKVIGITAKAITWLNIPQVNTQVLGVGWAKNGVMDDIDINYHYNLSGNTMAHPFRTNVQNQLISIDAMVNNRSTTSNGSIDLFYTGTIGAGHKLRCNIKGEVEEQI